MLEEKDFGFITLAFGAPKYLAQAEALAKSLRINMPGLPIALISDGASKPAVFDHLIPISRELGLGTVQKILLDRYSPFEETIFIDSDCIVTKPFDDEIEELRHFQFTPVCERYLNPEDQDSLYMHNLGEALRGVGGASFPKFNGGLYYFRRGPAASAVFEEARAILPRANKLGLKSFDKGGVADETLFGLALASLSAKGKGLSLYNDQGRLMRSLIGLSGRPKIDPLGGGCSFVKSGKEVSPAICHFAAPHSGYYPYAYARFLVNHPNTGPFLRTIASYFLRLKLRLAKWTALSIQQ